MQKQEVPDGYRTVVLPKDYKGAVITVDEDGDRKRAKGGDTVVLSEKTLKHDQHLLQFASDVTPSEKLDFYQNATTESLKKALKKRDLDIDTDRKDLVMTAREQGVPREELEFVDVSEKPKQALVKK